MTSMACGFGVTDTLAQPELSRSVGSVRVKTTSSPRQRGRPGGGRERILDVACDLISSHGMDEVRVARIAQVAGVSTALVHYHFTTREALLGEALRHAYARAGEARTALRATAGTDSARLLASMIEHCLPLPGRLEGEWVLWVELWLRAVRHPGLQDVAHELYARLHEWFADAIGDGVARGEFEVDDVDAAADVLLGAIDGIGVRVLARDPALPLERARELLLALASREVGAKLSPSTAD
jgi:AcrR family transcriptional regulator